jgi:uncharacterized protein YoxC
MTLITFFSALFISTIAAWFSIAGLIAIFPGAPVAVGLMGAALELGKLVSASWIYRFWQKTNILMRMYFIVAVMVLSLITSVGIFGYLTRAHVEGTQGLDANTEQITMLDEQITAERDNITSSRQALQQMDAAVNNMVGDVNRVERAVQIRNSQRRERTSLTASITESNTKIQQLQKQKAELNVGQRKLETEVGPIKYVAQLVYGTDDATTLDKAIQLLTLMLIFVFDPLAILLVIAANLTMKRDEQKPVVIPPTKNFADALNKSEPETRVNNTTNMEMDWNPGSWFKMVKSPKGK